MADSFEKQCEEFSFFRLPDIKLRVKRQLKEKQPLLAKQYLIRLREFMSCNYDKIYPLRSFMFWHLHNNPDFDDEIQRMIHEVEELLSESEKSIPKAKEGEKKQSKYGLNKVSRGIVLHYLMEYGNEKFRPTTDKVALSEYLVQIGEPVGTSGIQGYNKGALALANERSGRKAKPGKITKKDFLNALKCLESEDEQAFYFATEEFNSLCREDLDNEGGNYPKFFKK